MDSPEDDGSTSPVLCRKKKHKFKTKKLKMKKLFTEQADIVDLEDDCRSLSQTPVSVKEVPREIVLLSKKFNVNQSTAKTFHNILTKKAVVKILKLNADFITKRSVITSPRIPKSSHREYHSSKSIMKTNLYVKDNNSQSNTKNSPVSSKLVDLTKTDSDSDAEFHENRFRISKHSLKTYSNKRIHSQNETHFIKKHKYSEKSYGEKKIKVERSEKSTLKNSDHMNNEKNENVKDVNLINNHKSEKNEARKKASSECNSLSVQPAITINYTGKNNSNEYISSFAQIDNPMKDVPFWNPGFGALISEKGGETGKSIHNDNSGTIANKELPSLGFFEDECERNVDKTYNNEKKDIRKKPKPNYIKSDQTLPINTYKIKRISKPVDESDADFPKNTFKIPRSYRNKKTKSNDEDSLSIEENKGTTEEVSEDKLMFESLLRDVDGDLFDTERETNSSRKETITLYNGLGNCELQDGVFSSVAPSLSLHSTPSDKKNVGNDLDRSHNQSQERLSMPILDGPRDKVPLNKTSIPENQATEIKDPRLRKHLIDQRSLQVDSVSNAQKKENQSSQNAPPSLNRESDEDERNIFADPLSDEESVTSPRHRRFTSERESSMFAKRNRHEKVQNQEPISQSRPVINNSKKENSKLPNNSSRSVPPKEMNYHDHIKFVNYTSVNQGAKYSIPLNASRKNSLHAQSVIDNAYNGQPLCENSRKYAYNSIPTNRQPQFGDWFVLCNNDDFNAKGPDKFNIPTNWSSAEQTHLPPYITNQFSNFNNNGYTIVSKHQTFDNFFKGFCYSKLKVGFCHLNEGHCSFQHSLITLETTIPFKNPRELEEILKLILTNKFDFFLGIIWEKLISSYENNDHCLAVLQKVYSYNPKNQKIWEVFIDYKLNVQRESVENLAKGLAKVILKGDKDSMFTICQKIKPKLLDGFYWETIKDLCSKNLPPNDFLEIIILQFLKRNKQDIQVKEVYELISQKLSPEQRNTLNQHLLQRFYTLVKEKKIDEPVMIEVEVPEKSRSKSFEELNLINSNSNDNSDFEPFENVQKDIITQVDPQVVEIDESPLGEVLPKSSEEDKPWDKDKLKEIGQDQDIRSTHESVAREHYWKFFTYVDTINTALKHGDYDYVWKRIEEFSQSPIETSLLEDALYTILCKDIKSSADHLTAIISRAVKSGLTLTLIEAFFNVGISTMVALCDAELWVMAYQLLKSVRMFERQPMTDFILLSAEIYIANSRPLKAFELLQQTQLIRTNRDHWLVEDSRREHETVRNGIIRLLLKSLIKDCEKALNLLRFLLKDQYSPYYPIDLSLFIDQIALRLIFEEKDDLLFSLCRLVMDRDMTFQQTTYQEVICRVLPLDEILANQIFSYAINLGNYCNIKIDSFIRVIIDIKWKEEELYLLIKKLFTDIATSIGPGIEKLTPNQLKVIFVLEDIPTDKDLYRNEWPDPNTIPRVKAAKNQLIELLQTRFRPAVRIQRRNTGRICKIISRSLVNYLKGWDGDF